MHPSARCGGSWARSPPPSTLLLPEHRFGALLTGQEPKRSWERGQVCVVKKKKQKNKTQQITYFRVWAQDALTVSSNSRWDCNYCSGTFQKQERRGSFLSTTKLLAVTGAREEERQLWLRADAGPRQTARGSGWRACRPTDRPALSARRAVSP